MRRRTVSGRRDSPNRRLRLSSSLLTSEPNCWKCLYTPQVRVYWILLRCAPAPTPDSISTLQAFRSEAPITICWALKEAETWQASGGQFMAADKWSVWKGTRKLINCITGASVPTEARGLDEWVDVCALFYTVNLADARRGWCVAMVIWARHERAKKALPNRTRLLRTDKMRSSLRESRAHTAAAQHKHINHSRITWMQTWMHLKHSPALGGRGEGIVLHFAHAQ